MNDYDYEDCDDCGEPTMNDNFMFMLDIMRENKQLSKFNEIANYKMNLYLTAFIQLSNAITKYCPGTIFPMASEMGDEVMGEQIADEFIAEFAENCKKMGQYTKAKPSKKKKK
jgi:hypothetical protein